MSSARTRVASSTKIRDSPSRSVRYLTYAARLATGVETPSSARSHASGTKSRIAATILVSSSLFASPSAASIAEDQGSNTWLRIAENGDRVISSKLGQL